jgi:zinc protease
VPEPATVASRRELPTIGVTVVRFANGVEAWLKPTDFKNDQILFTMYSPGGLSLASRSDFVDARFATTYVELSGVGSLKATDLQKMLAGKLVSAAPYVTASTHGLTGSAAPAELETALQLLYENFVEPGDDPDAFALMKRQLEASVANRDRSPGQLFGEKLAQINTSKHFTAEPLTADRVAALDSRTMRTFYRERFSNAADFTFFMVGAFKLDAAIPLLARYVGTLPSTGAKTAQYRDLGMRFPSMVERAQVEKGREPRSQTVISFYADPPFEPVEQERIGTATTVLETVLRDSLRETLGQTYTVSVRLAQSPPQRGDGYVAVSFGAAPENISTMADRVLQEVKRLQTEGPSADLVGKAKEGARRDYETALRQNGYWMRRLQSIHFLGGNPEDIITRSARIDATSQASVQDAFRKYFPLDRYTIVTLVPEARQ